MRRLLLACFYCASAFSSVSSWAIGGRRFLGQLRISQQDFQHHQWYNNNNRICNNNNNHKNNKNNENRFVKELPAITHGLFSSPSSSLGTFDNKELPGSDVRERKTTRTKVVVVGAGISGLSVAYHLWKLSSSSTTTEKEKSSYNNNSSCGCLDIEILEVRNRIGGRIEPFQIGSNNNSVKVATWIDLGGQWLHESSPENPIRRLMEDDLNLMFVGDDNKPPPQTDKKEETTTTTTTTTTTSTSTLTKSMSSKKTKNTNKPKNPNRFSERKLKNVLFDQNGTLLDKAMVHKAKTVFYKAMDDGMDEHEHDSNSISFRDLLDARTEFELRSDHFLRKALSSPTISSSPSSFAKAMNYFVDRSEGYEGGKLHEVSAVLANNLYTGFGSAPDRVVKGSYRSLLEALSSKMGLNDSDDDDNEENEEEIHCKVRLRRNARVDQIEYGRSDSKANASGDDKTISLSVVKTEMPPSDDANTNNDDPVVDDTVAASALTSTASVLECDYCVCTVPLGVLQQRKIEFVPPLPQKRQEAIDGIGMGLLNKIVFRFDFENLKSSNDSNSDNDNDNDNDSSYKFWGSLKQFGICHEDPALVKSYYDCTDDYYYCENDTTNTTNTNTANDGSTRSAILVQFLAGSAADRVDPPLLDGNGNASVDVGLTDQEAIDESLEALRSVFGSDAVPNPAVSKVTRWRNDPWSCGSYSFTKVGSSPSMYDEIASPLPSSHNRHNNNDNDYNNNGRLLFAGEHTSKHFHSTVHGAWETGGREANRIFDQLLLQKQKQQQ